MRTRQLIQKLIQDYNRCISFVQTVDNLDNLKQGLRANNMYYGVCYLATHKYDVHIGYEPFIKRHKHDLIGSFWCLTPSELWCLATDFDSRSIEYTASVFTTLRRLIVDTLCIRRGILETELKRYPWYKPGPNLKSN